MPDFTMSLRTMPYVVDCRNPRWRPSNTVQNLFPLPQVETAFARCEMAPRSNIYLHNFSHGRLGYDTVDTARRRLPPKFKMAATETGNGDTTIERNELQPNCIGYTPHLWPFRIRL